MVAATLGELRAKLARERPFSPSKAAISTGIPALDDVLPTGGLAAGSLVEWWLPEGSGGVELAARSLSTAVGPGKTWCVIRSTVPFCPLPAFANPRPVSCLLVCPRTDSEHWWAVEQALRCPGVALTWCWAERTPERVLRRWQVAAETGGGIGMIFRPSTGARQAAWASLRLAVTPLPGHTAHSRRARVDVLYSRGHFAGQSLVLEWNHASGALRVAAELDHSTTPAIRPRLAEPAAGRVG